MSKKKTTTKAAPAAANEKAVKGARAEIRERIERLDAAENGAALHEAVLDRGDGEKVKVSVPGDEPAQAAAAPAAPTLAQDAPVETPASKPARKPKAAAKAPTPPTAPRAAKPAKEPKTRKVSALDAAAAVIAKADKPLRASDLIESMLAEKLWKSPGGKTPEATLYAAIIREIAAKGKDARFRKVDRGLFAAGKGA